MTTMRLTLQPVNADVWSLCTAQGAHLGNLKRIGAIWKFKAVGYGTDGGVEPGGGPLTEQHNTVFDSPDLESVNARLGPHLWPALPAFPCSPGNA
jgi:hypothetical protein